MARLQSLVLPSGSVILVIDKLVGAEVDEIRSEGLNSLRGVDEVAQVVIYNGTLDVASSREE